MKMKTHDYQATNVLDVIKNVAVYLRKSRGESDNDLQRHRGVILDICKNNEWVFIEYAEIVSGEKISNRPKMQELLRDVEDDMYDAVFVYDYDRLGRGNGADQHKITETLKNSDTLVIEANPFNVLDPNSERDETMMDFKGFVANQEYKMIKKRMASGKKISLKMGHWANGYAPYGYEINQDFKKLVVVEEQKAIFRKHILKSYLNGSSSLTIVDDLARYKYYTNRGYEWNAKAVFYALTNKTYLGHTYYNRRDKKGNMKPENEWSVSLNTHEAIMSEDEMEQVLAIKEKRSITGKKTINALGSLIKCYKCGNSMRIRKDGGSRKVYKCTSCNENRGGQLEIVENAILASLRRLQGILEKGETVVVKENKSEAITKEIERIEHEIVKCKEAISKIEDAFEMGMYDADKAMERTRKRQNEITEWNTVLKKEKKKLSQIEQPNDNINLSNVSKLLSSIEEGNDDKQLKKLYNDMFDAIIWERNKWDEISVELKFK